MGPPETIVLIRHGEKPTVERAAPFGVDVDGNHNFSSLQPQGWQRAGALATLFHLGLAPVATPGQLYSPRFITPEATVNHRTYQTILPLMRRLNVDIQNPFGPDDEHRLAAAIVARDVGVSLVCWEHHRIPAIASNLPVANREQIPSLWPDDRYDLIWLFTLTTASPPAYRFVQLPQRLLAGDVGL